MKLRLKPPSFCCIHVYRPNLIGYDYDFVDEMNAAL